MSGVPPTGLQERKHDWNVEGNIAQAKQLAPLPVAAPIVAHAELLQQVANSSQENDSQPGSDPNARRSTRRSKQQNALRTVLGVANPASGQSRPPQIQPSFHMNPTPSQSSGSSQQQVGSASQLPAPQDQLHSPPVSSARASFAAPIPPMGLQSFKLAVSSIVGQLQAASQEQVLPNDRYHIAHVGTIAVPNSNPSSASTSNAGSPRTSNSLQAAEKSICELLSKLQPDAQPAAMALWKKKHHSLFEFAAALQKLEVRVRLNYELSLNAFKAKLARLRLVANPPQSRAHQQRTNSFRSKNRSSSGGSSATPKRGRLEAEEEEYQQPEGAATALIRDVEDSGVHRALRLNAKTTEGDETLQQRQPRHRSESLPTYLSQCASVSTPDGKYENHQLVSHVALKQSHNLAVAAGELSPEQQRTAMLLKSLESTPDTTISSPVSTKDAFSDNDDDDAVRDVASFSLPNPNRLLLVTAEEAELLIDALCEQLGPETRELVVNARRRAKEWHRHHQQQRARVEEDTSPQPRLPDEANLRLQPQQPSAVQRFLDDLPALTRPRPDVCYPPTFYEGLEHLLESEVRWGYLPYFGPPTQPEVNLRVRMILVDWMVDVALRYKFCNEALHLSVALVDRFLAVNQVVRGEVQLVGVAALFLAAKYEEIYPPDVNDLVGMTAKTYTKQEILRMERLIFVLLNFRVTIPTSNVFLQHFLAEQDPTPSTLQVHIALYCIEALTHYEVFGRFRPSHCASAAIFISRIWCSVPTTKSPPPEVAAVIPAIEKAIYNLVANPEQRIRALRQKYASQTFSRVSTLSFPSREIAAALGVEPEI